MLSAFIFLFRSVKTKPSSSLSEDSGSFVLSGCAVGIIGYSVGNPETTESTTVPGFGTNYNILLEKIVLFSAKFPLRKNFIGRQGYTIVSEHQFWGKCNQFSPNPLGSTIMIISVSGVHGSKAQVLIYFNR